MPVLCARVDSRRGRPRSLSVKGLLVGVLLNAMQPGHSGKITAIAGTINALADKRRNELGITDWNSREAYRRVDRLFNKIAHALQEGWEAEVDGELVTIDGNWVANRLLRAAIDHELPASRTIAIDGTAWPTTARLHPGDDTVEFDGDAAAKQAAEQVGSASRDERPRRAAVLGIGPDGRRQYTRDPDARGGYRTATDRQAGSEYVGYEVHLGVSVRDVAWTNHIDKVTFEDEPPYVITVLQLSRAGSHRGEAITAPILEAKRQGTPVDEAIMDPGYSMCRPESCLVPLRQGGVEPVFKPVKHQRDRRIVNPDYYLLDGQLYSRHLPDDLGGGDTPTTLPLPDRGASREQREASEATFNRRARYRAVPHSRPDADGYRRYKCPFCAGLLHSRQTGRRAATKSAVTTSLRDGAETCCSGTTTHDPLTLAWDQRIPVGTTAWRMSYNRRNRVETGNSILKGRFVDIEASNFIHVFGLAKRALLLGATIAGYNRYAARSHRSKQEAQREREREQQPRRRAKRRTRTYHAIQAGDTAEATGPERDPPGADPPG